MIYCIRLNNLNYISSLGLVSSYFWVVFLGKSIVFIACRFTLYNYLRMKFKQLGSHLSAYYQMARVYRYRTAV